MIQIDIPGRRNLEISNVVLDFNGTIAMDGKIIEELLPTLDALQHLVKIYVLTADTYGTVKEQCIPLGLEIMTFPQDDAAKCKADIVKQLKGGVICIGNGYNDIQMFELSDLSIGIIEHEGICGALVAHSDVVVLSAKDGLELLLHPNRLKATLRA